MGAAVTKRQVFYCHGYDPEANTRYRRIFMIGLAQLARRFRIERKIGAVVDDAAIPASRWTVTAGTAAWRTETTYEILRWDDLVEGDFRRDWRQRVRNLVFCMAATVRERYLGNLFRLDWHFACLVIFPWLALIAAVAAALGIGGVTTMLIGLAVPLSPATAAVLTVAAAGAVLIAAHPLFKRAYVYHLLDDWIFHFQFGTGQRADIEARLERFAERIVAAARQTEAQEVLIVGHSTGSIIAVEVAARALALDPDLGRRGPALALLTIGAELPIVGYIPMADSFRQAIVRLATANALLWVEYQAPQDVLNAYRFEPVRDLKLDLGGLPQTNPHIRSPRFRETLSPETYRKMKWNFFRVHFQFLMPVEIPGEYDYPMIVCGPVALADRIADPEAAVRAAYGPRAGSPCAADQRDLRQR